jgi:cyclohexyl-isocyanide hydratase
MSPKLSPHIGFPLFSDLTQLDFTGPFEVLARLPGAQCHVIAKSLEPVRSQSGLSLLPTATYGDCPKLDILCVPGGPGHLAAMQDETVIGFLRAQAPGCRYVTSVCTGSLILAAAGLLEGYRATSHWGSLERLATFGAIPVAERVVIDRNRITGGGVTAGIDFALTLLARIGGETLAREVALQIEYAPAPPFPGSPAEADPITLRTLTQRLAPYQAAMAKVDSAIKAPASKTR